MPARDLDEDLPRVAAESFALAGQLCSCGPIHALWPYIRLARASTGVEAAASQLESRLAALIGDGRRGVLIAGAADTGLLALVARAAGTHPADIIVLDRCAAPLESCRRLARRWSLPIETLHQDLLTLDAPARFDLVLVHGTLHFIAADRRADVLARLRRALRPGGRLVLLFNTSRPIAGDLVPENRDGYADWVIEELDRRAIPLPEDRPGFRARLRAHAQERETREGAFGDAEDAWALLAGAGFSVRDRCEIGVTLAAPVQSFVAKISKRRFLAIAEPR
jgi:SAM-dependent methyltransferase